MVSQPTMRRISEIAFCLLGLTAVLLFFVACGQNEGGRCQIDSDCASGLKCTNGTTGNGTCGPQITVAPTSDAAPAKDLAEDLPVVSGPEVGIDTVAMPEIDAETIDTGSVD
jgi:hypothetical protein